MHAETPIIYNHTNRDMSSFSKIFEEFEQYARKKLKYDKPFVLNFKSDPENAKDVFGKTAYYDPASMGITIFIDDRHPKDILRSISHEMVHHAQNCRGDFDGIDELGEGYAQKNPHLRKMEGEAYLLGNGFLVRDFEDARKCGDKMMNEFLKTDLINRKQKLILENQEDVSKAASNNPQQSGRDVEKTPTTLKGSVVDHYDKRNERIGDEVFKKFMRRK